MSDRFFVVTGGPGAGKTVNKHAKLTPWRG